MASNPCPDLLLLAIRYVDGELPADEMAAFEGLLAQDQKARAAVAEAVKLAGVSPPLPAPPPAVLPSTRLRRRVPFRPVLGAAAAVLALAVCLGVLARRPAAVAPPEAQT